ncbi:protease inhibitor I9 family protein, partial [Vibrio cholerae]
RYIVKFKNADAAVQISAENVQASDQLPTTMNYQPQVAEISAQHSVLNKANAREMKRIGRSNSYSVKLDNTSLKALKARTDVEYVEEDAP